MGVTATITEAAFLKMVLDLARLRGWRTMHVRPLMSRRGRWSTAYQGMGVGWPDVFACRGERAIAAELKVGRGKLTVDQAAWLGALRTAGVEAYQWSPEDWPEIERLLA